MIKTIQLLFVSFVRMPFSMVSFIRESPNSPFHFSFSRCIVQCIARGASGAARAQGLPLPSHRRGGAESENSGMGCAGNSFGRLVFGWVETFGVATRPSCCKRIFFFFL